MSKRKIAPGPYVVPMPVVLVGAEVDGRPNFMTAAFVTVVNFKPPVVVCGLSPRHRTVDGIVAHGTFSLNVPPAGLVEATDHCGLVSGKKVDKSQVFEVFHGDLPHAPLVAECPLNVECRVLQSVPFAVDTAFFGEVVAVHADESILQGDEVDWAKLGPLLFTFPDAGYWRLGEHVAKAWDVGKGYGRS